MGESTAKSVCYVRFGCTLGGFGCTLGGVGCTLGGVGRTLGGVGRRLTVQGDPLCRFLSSIGL